MIPRRRPILALLPVALLLVVQTSLPLSFLCPDGICAIARSGLLTEPVVFCLTSPEDCGACRDIESPGTGGCCTPSAACETADNDNGATLPGCVPTDRTDCGDMPICPLKLADCQLCLPSRLSAVLTPPSAPGSDNHEFPIDLVVYPNPAAPNPGHPAASHSPPRFGPGQSGYERRVVLCSFLC